MTDHKNIQRIVTILLPRVKISSLPGEWEEAGGDYRGWKIDVQGKDLGGYGHRRIVVRAPFKYPWKEGSIVQARAMRTTRRVEDGDLTYKYLALDKSSHQYMKGYEYPLLSWNVFEMDIDLKLSGKVRWISNAHWYQTVDALDRQNGTYRVGVLAITDRNNAFSIINKDTDEELFVVDGQ